MGRGVQCVLFLLLVFPSAWFAWRNRAMPQLGQAHDDAIYFSVSKAVAQGEGYRIVSLPQRPYETKYPPVPIWLLSGVWLMNPRFPGNLVLATAMQWVMIPAFLLLAGVWFRSIKLPPVWSWAALAILAVNPYTIMFGAGIYTESLFSIFALLSLFSSQRALDGDETRWAVYAGLAAALAYLTRTAGVVLVVSTPAVFWFWGKRRQALWFLLSMIPAVILWTTWARLHGTASNDLVLTYNTDYVRFWLTDIHFRDLGAVIWKNAGYLLDSIGSLAVPGGTSGLAWPAIRIGAGVIVLRGISRELANPAFQLYAAFAVLTFCELLVWDFPPNLRLMYPLAPLFVFGLIREVRFFGNLLRQAASPVGARILGSVAAAGALAAVSLSAYSTFRTLPELVRQSEMEQRENIAAFEWIEQHSSTATTVLSFNPALYLYTGRHTEAFLTLPVYWYRGDRDRMLAPLAELSSYISRRGLDLVYFNQNDYEKLFPDHGKEAQQLVENNPALKVVFRYGRGTVYSLAAP